MISISKFTSVRRLLFPVVASPPVEEVLSTGAVEAGVERRSKVGLDGIPLYNTSIFSIP